MPVILSSRLHSRRLRLSRLHSLAENILRASDSARADLSLMLVGDRSMRRLNRLYRRKDRTTDVLAFPIGKHRARPLSDLLGDVVISLPQAAKQAKRAGHSLEHELTVLMIHGLLHLLGYDHERNAREAHRMQRKERAILRSLRTILKLKESDE
jgi:probable rRNA maturation factor